MRTRLVRVLCTSQAVWLVLELARSAHAQGSLRLEPNQRLVELQARLDDGQPGATRWWYGWLGGYLALTVGQGVVFAVSPDAGLRANMLVGGAGSLAGILCTLASRLPAMDAGDRLRAISPSDVQGFKVAAGERLLDDSADAEVFGRSWIAHGVGILIASAQGLVLWKGYQRPGDGAFSFVSSLAVSEVQIFSQPTRAIDDRREYRQGSISPPQQRQPLLGLAMFPQSVVIWGRY